MMKSFKVVLSLIIGFTMNAVSLGASQPSGSKSLVEKVEAQYAQTKDLQADFTQETRFEGFETGFSSSGKLYLKKPGLLRWDYLEPSKEQIYVDGDQVMMYVPDHQQVVKGNLTQLAASKGPLALLQDVGTLSQQFTIIDSSPEDRGDGTVPVLTLVPKPNGEGPPTLKKIVLKLTPDSFLIQEITLFETSGNVSRVAFDHIQVNQGVSAQMLQFSVPSDVVVVEMPTLR
ncbi:MAG: outer membrane lipoprotein carrier protein LolA [Nitrospirales bacterium]